MDKKQAPKLKINMQALAAFLKKYDLIIVWGIALFLLACVFIYISIKSSKDGDKVVENSGLVEQPLPTSSTTSVTVPTNVTDELEKDNKKRPVYEVSKTDKTILVEEVLAKLGRGGITKSLDTEDIKIWGDTSNTDSDFVQYDLTVDEVYIDFKTPAPIPNTSVSFVSPDNIEKYFADIVLTLFNSPYKYTDFTLTKEDNNYKLEAHRVVDELPLFTPTLSGATDYIVVEEDGDLVKAQFLLVDFDENKTRELTVLTPIQLGNAINLEDYPKTYQQGFTEELLNAFPEYFYSTDDPNFLGDAPPLDDEVPLASSCTATNMKLVYYYYNTTYKQVAPTYRIECEGQVNYKGSVYNVPGLIYASAIDPDFVYVPNENSSN